MKLEKKIASLSKYGIDENNPKDATPSSILKVITFTVEQDYTMVIREDASVEEVLQKFKDGEYNHLEPQLLTSRLYESNIKVNESYEWGGANGQEETA